MDGTYICMYICVYIFFYIENNMICMFSYRANFKYLTTIRLNSGHWKKHNGKV